MRLFAALALPEAVTGELYAWWESASAVFPPSLWRDAPPRNWHVTLAFFGEVQGMEVNDLAEALGACAARAGPLQMTLDGFGAFPSLPRSRVLWAGVDGGGDLPRLARCCRLAGHATLRKRSARDEPFRAHVTLARASGALAIEPADVEAMPPMPLLSWTAEVLALMQSTLRPEGARYRILEDFPLGE